MPGLQGGLSDVPAYEGSSADDQDSHAGTVPGIARADNAATASERSDQLAKHVAHGDAHRDLAAGGQPGDVGRRPGSGRRSSPPDEWAFPGRPRQAPMICRPNHPSAAANNDLPAAIAQHVQPWHQHPGRGHAHDGVHHVDVELGGAAPPPGSDQAAGAIPRREDHDRRESSGQPGRAGHVSRRQRWRERPGAPRASRPGPAGPAAGRSSGRSGAGEDAAECLGDPDRGRCRDGQHQAGPGRPGRRVDGNCDQGQRGGQNDARSQAVLAEQAAEIAVRPGQSARFSGGQPGEVAAQGLRSLHGLLLHRRPVKVP